MRGVFHAGIAAADPDKAPVMTYLRDLVNDGYAAWHTLEDGSIQLRLNTGETYLLEPKTITRLA